MRRHPVLPSLRGLGRMALIAAAAAPLASCTTAQLSGTSPSYLIISSLEGASGAEPDELSNVLASDVVTLVEATAPDGTEVRVPTIFEDNGLVTFTLGMRDPGSASQPSEPSAMNFITVTRYRVQFVRADGRNVPGVDVPYAFDGAATGTVTGSGGGVSFSLVRAQAKSEAPLAALASSGPGAIISTIAQVTFYGQDQAGREVSVTGNIGVNFANWGDPD